VRGSDCYILNTFFHLTNSFLLIEDLISPISLLFMHHFSFRSPHVSLFRVNVAAAVKTLSTTSSSFGATSSAIDEKLQRQLLEEEEQAMAKYKVSQQNIYKGISLSVY